MKAGPVSGSRAALAFKVASVLLQYPTPALFDGLAELEEAAGNCGGAAGSFGQFMGWIDSAGPDGAARHYVEVFDLRRRCALYLTYYRHGDTRRRGMAMVEFTAAYRAADLVPASGELPDYLPMVLDFAAAHPRGAALLRRHRAEAELLRHALRDLSSPYALVVEGVCACLPAPRRPDLAVVRRILDTGPPTEEVGLAEWEASR